MSTFGREADEEWRRRQQLNVVQMPRGNGHDKESRIKLTPFSHLTVGTDRPYLVKNLIPRVGLTVMTKTTSRLPLAQYCQPKRQCSTSVAPS